MTPDDPIVTAEDEARAIHEAARLGILQTSSTPESPSLGTAGAHAETAPPTLTSPSDGLGLPPVFDDTADRVHSSTAPKLAVDPDLRSDVNATGVSEPGSSIDWDERSGTVSNDDARAVQLRDAADDTRVLGASPSLQRAPRDVLRKLQNKASEARRSGFFE